MTKLIGKLAIIGDEFIPSRLIRILEWLVETGMMEVVSFMKFDVSGKIDGYGMVEENSMGIVINLQRHIDFVKEEIMKHHEGAALRLDCHLYWSLLNTVLHEIFHCQHLYTRNMEGNEEEMPGEEAVNELAEEFIDVMAKEIDIEPEMSAWMMEQLAPTFEAIEKAEEGELAAQKELIKAGLVVADKELGVICRTFKEYRRITSDTKDDPAWLVPTGEKKMELVKQEVPVPEKAAPTITPVAKVEDAFSDALIPVEMGDGQIEFTDGYEQALPEEYADQPEETAGEGGGSQHKTGLKDYTVKILEGLPKNNHIPAEAFKKAMVTLATRMHNHIFQKCRFNPQAGGSGFESAWNVLDPLYIADIPYIQEILTGYDKTISANGQMQKKICFPIDWNGPVPGCISGIVFGKTGLPAFNIYLNFRGKQYARALIPQNINGTNKWAVKARNGEAVSYLKDRNTAGPMNNIGAVVGNKGFEFWKKA